jgi:hypothetical protein
LSLSQQFFSEPQRKVSFSAGKTFMPCHFRKVHYTVCLFKTDKQAVLQKLEGTGLLPALKWGKHYMVAIGLVRYDDCDLGTYNEVIVAIPSIPQGMNKPLSSWVDLVRSLNSRKVGQHIIHIPVTSFHEQQEMNCGVIQKLWRLLNMCSTIHHCIQKFLILLVMSC